MKTVICCHYLNATGEFPDRGIFPTGRRGHDLIWLLNYITDQCFPESYVSQISAARVDVEFLRGDEQLRCIVKILSDFGQSARYYNLNVVLGENDPGPSPDEEWQRLEEEILQEDSLWAERIVDPSQRENIHQYINSRLTIHCEKLARSLSRLFTIGGLGELARQISVHTHHFLFLMDDQLGTTDYVSVHA